jgi:hypothetical protein
LDMVRDYYRQRRGSLLRQAFTTYIRLQSVTKTAEVYGVSRQTVHSWIDEWLRLGSGDAQRDLLTLRAALGTIRARGRLRPRPGNVPAELAKAWARSLRFDTRLTLVLEEKLKSFNMDAVSWERYKEKKLSKVLEDAAKKKRRDSEKSAVGL